MQEMQGHHSGRHASGGSARWEISLAVLLLYCRFQLSRCSSLNSHTPRVSRAVRNHSRIRLSSCGITSPSVNDVTASFSRVRCDHVVVGYLFVFNDHFITTCR